MAVMVVDTVGIKAEGAKKEYGGTTFTVVGIDSAINKLQDQECRMQIVVNPGEL